MPSADEILQKMRALQERREAAVGPLVEILARRSRLLEQLAELDEPYGKAYVDAEAAGWTPEELAKLGADEPVKRPRVRSRRSRPSTRTTGGQSSGPATEDGSLAGEIPSQNGAATADGATLGAASS
ncbi:hypothetical protein SAM23877_6485 [Streptomyces ambofaciens ATCC 23877]|uniref:Uncharacterized protein n=1 Tax=Streptomyces ambofaciens (strain ATCC 23877 / 3486 / DSM 40053 / JCM 4204 / NBRC 12836 / NRRL B-2516) TaxID=278992 RepID=A0AE86_STRA7|nr:hypothetical protein [Streptomyces ambofaciens]AKZ59530.1 hypothetical protein SAM23877_6485 [Streptomyces ambofaciens ATCC 23877]CAJ88795.1 conserved hypothetical protein [Streptomyces ambofaciens ATCC 23877]